ncbi:uncharacterized protein LOC135121258 isoform X2 [Zophobas morio]|uniref:uncharacterized protein LOC135121258 isoform X2 n=1 Tax=Zophobas morio TaxID=2755281 RepID=UPI003082B884
MNMSQTNELVSPDFSLPPENTPLGKHLRKNFPALFAQYSVEKDSDPKTLTTLTVREETVAPHSTPSNFLYLDESVEPCVVSCGPEQSTTAFLHQLEEVECSDVVVPEPTSTASLPALRQRSSSLLTIQGDASPLDSVGMLTPQLPQRAKTETEEFKPGMHLVFASEVTLSQKKSNSVDEEVKAVLPARSPQRRKKLFCRIFSSVTLRTSKATAQVLPEGGFSFVYREFVAPSNYEHLRQQVFRDFLFLINFDEEFYEELLTFLRHSYSIKGGNTLRFLRETSGFLLLVREQNTPATEVAGLILYLYNKYIKETAAFHVELPEELVRAVGGNVTSYGSPAEGRKREAHNSHRLSVSLLSVFIPSLRDATLLLVLQVVPFLESTARLSTFCGELARCRPMLEKKSIFREFVCKELFGELIVNYKKLLLQICSIKLVRDEFRKALDSECSAENLDFYHKARTYKSNYDSSTPEINIVTAEKIVSCYIQEGAENEINISDGARKSCLTGSNAKHMFDLAIREVEMFLTTAVSRFSQFSIVKLCGLLSGGRFKDA